jgi:hypothetical protein
LDLGENSNGLKEERTGVELNKITFYPVIEGTCVNTKNWYREETDLWAEFGRKAPFGKRFSSKHSVKMPVVRSVSAFGRRAVSRLEEEAFGYA